MAEGISGAGAEVTALAESLQAYACATRQHLRKPLTDVTQITKDTIRDAVADRTLEKCIKGLDSGWYHSVIVTANKIFDDIRPQGKYIFYRGGNLVSDIYKVFSDFRKTSGLTGDDKWNPADIWMVKERFVFEKNWTTLDDYNLYIYNQFALKNLIGISLKKIPKGDANSKIYNDGKPIVAEFNGIKLGQDMFDSKDIYLRYISDGKEGEIQLRNFSSRPVTSSWQGEIKGKTAAGGKIGGGIIITAALESGISRSKLMLPPSFNAHINNPSEIILKKFAVMFKELSGSKKKVEELVTEARIRSKQDPTWWMSKFLGVHYVYTIVNEKKQNDVVKWMYSYASSATKNSSIFIKYS
jgi:hypothetical protein